MDSKVYKTKEEVKFYQSRQWHRVRQICINRCNGIDVYSYYVLGRLDSGQVVHHIKPLREDWTSRFKVDNLIYLTEKNHRLVHKLMKQGSKDKECIQMLLCDLLYRYKKEIEGGGI